MQRHILNVFIPQFKSKLNVFFLNAYFICAFDFLHFRYYAVCFLNQLILTKKDSDLASALITIYFSLFKVMQQAFFTTVLLSIDNINWKSHFKM